VKKSIRSLFLLAALAGFAVPAESMGKRNVELSPVDYRLERELSLPDIWTALHPEDEGPTIVASEESIQFLGTSGRELKRLQRPPYSDVIFSKDGAYIGLRELAVPGKDPGAPRMLTFSLFSRDGQKLWTVHHSLDYDDPLPGFRISSAGRVVMVESPESILSFYDEQGSVDRRVQLFGDALWSNERPMAYAFSADGEHFAVNALDRLPRTGDEMSPREPGRSFLILLDARGTELWRRQLDSELSTRVAISDRGECIAAGGYAVKGMDVVEQSTFLYNGRGEFTATLDIPFRFADFSADGQLLLLGWKNDLHLVRTASGKRPWTLSLPAEAGQLRTLALAPDGGLALALQAAANYRGSRFVYTHPRVSLHDQTGRQIWQGEFPEDSFLRPTAGFLEDGGRFFLALTGRYLIYGPEK